MPSGEGSSSSDRETELQLDDDIEHSRDDIKESAMKIEENFHILVKVSSLAGK